MLMNVMSTMVWKAFESELVFTLNYHFQVIFLCIHETSLYAYVGQYMRFHSAIIRFHGFSNVMCV